MWNVCIGMFIDTSNLLLVQVILRPTLSNPLQPRTKTTATASNNNYQKIWNISEEFINKHYLL
jgi:hypothetical protein